MDPQIQSARFGDPEPAATTVEILIFSSKQPECEYEEIGLVSGRQRGFWTTLENVLEKMRERAREMGGHAIVGLGTSEVVTGGTETAGSVSLNTTGRLAGTVVRFTDPSCRR